MKRAFPLITAIALLLSSCAEKPSTTELLTTDDWHMTTLTINPAIVQNGVAITDYYNQLYDHEKDNLLRFSTDGTFIADEGPTKENPTDPQTKQGNWLLSASENMITVWVEMDTLTYSLLHVSQDALSLSYSERDTASQINYTLTAGFVHP